MNIEQISYKCHIMICVNDRQDERLSCADSGGKEIQLKLKKAIKQMGLPKKDIRVSQSLCMGSCNTGPNVMIYPQNIMFNHVKLDDVPLIIEKIKDIVS